METYFHFRHQLKGYYQQLWALYEDVTRTNEPISFHSSNQFPDEWSIRHYSDMDEWYFIHSSSEIVSAKACFRLRSCSGVGSSRALTCCDQITHPPSLPIYLSRRSSSRFAYTCSKVVHLCRFEVEEKNGLPWGAFSVWRRRRRPRLRLRKRLKGLVNASHLGFGFSWSSFYLNLDGFMNDLCVDLVGCRDGRWWKYGVGLWRWQINKRGDTIDEKIKKLDGELFRYREQIKKTRPGPAQEAIKARAMRILKQKKM